MADDHGTASAELVVLLVPVMVLLAFAVFAGRYSATNQEVGSAARDAARAAAVTGSPSAAEQAALKAASDSLADRAVSCRTLNVDLDATLLQPGGEVTVEVTCSLGLTDLVGLGMPGTVTASATSTVVVDTFRGGG